MFAQRIRPERATDEMALNRPLALMASRRDSRLNAHPRAFQIAAPQLTLIRPPFQGEFRLAG